MRDARLLLRDWYRPRRRAYPWRGAHDPYVVLVSEVMLHQTQAARVVPAFGRFLATFPSLVALAAASRAEVVRAWDGLGYNRRAVSLSEAARAIVRDHGGRVPSDPRTLRRLPGVGPYTAAAVASFAFGVPVAAVDTNVRRIVARVHEGAEGDDVLPARIGELASGWLDRDAPGDWNQALMDLGREVCRPLPRCSVCPLAEVCRFRASGRAPAPAHRRQGRFEGSPRQVRGAVVGVLRRHRTRTLASLVVDTGFEHERIRTAVEALDREGVVAAGVAARAGRPLGRVRLAT